MSNIVDKAIDLIEGRKPKLPRVSLQAYVELTKNIQLDAWQIDLCERLERAFWLSQSDKFQFLFFDYVGPEYYLSPSGLKISKNDFEQNKNAGDQAAIHAPPQLGKSIIISQCYVAWVLGYDPLHRFRLATYNIYHSARFSVVIKNLIKSPEHRYLFPNPSNQIPRQSKTAEWSTIARLEYYFDGQASFGALGLASGFVGTSCETLIIDDPYKSAEEAMSEVIRDKTWRFWSDTARPRMTPRSNVFIMFHRYHQDDMGGRAIASKDDNFKLWRYAAEADGTYEDPESGRKFKDPMKRKIGEYLSPRFGPTYYERQKANEQVWYSQFQGQPTAKTGKMFDVSKFTAVHPRDAPKEMMHRVRAWDNAATEGGGAYTAGVDTGIDAAENIYVFGVERKQVGTAERQLLQESTAERDGKLVHIHVPQDPGSAGKDVAFEFQQKMANLGYLVTVTKVSGSKEMRAYSTSQAGNSGRIFLLLNADGSTPDWHKPFKNEFHLFPVGTYKDMVDAFSDSYNFLIKLFYRGLVVKSKVEKNLLPWSAFRHRIAEKIPTHWDVACAVRIAPDSSKPSGYCITTRAAENAHIGERLFLVASARMYVHDPVQVLKALAEDLDTYCERGVQHPDVIWLNRGAGDVLQVAAEKMDLRVAEFKDESTAGVPEMNWYLQETENQCPFTPRLRSPRAYALVDEAQLAGIDVKDEAGQLSLRQDFRSWSYTDKGEVQPYGGIVLDCFRMTVYKFALTATSLSEDERLMAKLKPELQPEAIRKVRGTPEFIERHFAQLHALQTIRADERDEKQLEALRANDPENHFGKRAAVRRFYRDH